MTNHELKQEKLVFTAVYVHESGKKATEWFLLSTVKIKGEKDVKKLIECYAQMEDRTFSLHTKEWL